MWARIHRLLALMPSWLFANARHRDPCSHKKALLLGAHQGKDGEENAALSVTPGSNSLPSNIHQDVLERIRLSGHKGKEVY